MEQLKPPGHLSMEGNLAENWKEWIQGFELFLTATGIGEKPEKDEPIDNYLTDLRNKAQPCEFEHLSDGLIRDRIVCGIKDEVCRARLLRESDLTLKKAIDICRAQEMSTKQLKSLKGSEEQAVAAIRKSTSSKKFSSSKNTKRTENQRPESSSGKSCRNCGRKHMIGECPAYGKTCNSCHKKNHFEKYCFSKQNKSAMKIHTVGVPYDVNSDVETELFIGTLHVDSVDPDKSDWTETLTINEHSVVFKLDTGAQANIIPKHIFDKLELPDKQLTDSKVRLVAYGGTEITAEGTKILECSVRDRKYDLPFFIVDTKAQAILGRKACTEIGAIVRVLSVEKELTKETVLNAYEDVFKGLGELPGKHHISIDKTVTPVIHPPRKVPALIRDAVKTELDRMETLGVIAKQDEPTDWVHSLVTVRKPNKIRVCIDPKDLNRAIKREHYHLQTVEEVIEKLPQAKVFSKFDATHGFWHIKLDEPSSKLLTFNTPFGRYRYLRLPFGISSAPEVFSKRVQEMFSDLTGVECIVDDILVWGETTAEHDSRVQQMLQRCREMNFKLNKSKVEYRVPEVKYVGHLITNNGIKVDPEKVRAIVEMPSPIDVSGVKRVLGLVQYVAKFIPNLSDVTAPLRVLTQEDVAWHWDTPQQESFDRLKQCSVFTMYVSQSRSQEMRVLRDLVSSFYKMDIR
uniref:Uncharacterized protein K02A2.6-like n=1 Tax=Crassostrea virginica TaxID=6565 RepID=A0A8B8AXM9_CRAVI|nr:uncharacterized protein K02A2.6-like [Crassostrea virginica]